MGGRCRAPEALAPRADNQRSWLRVRCTLRVSRPAVPRSRRRSFERGSDTRLLAVTATSGPVWRSRVERSVSRCLQAVALRRQHAGAERRADRRTASRREVGQGDGNGRAHPQPRAYARAHRLARVVELASALYAALQRVRRSLLIAGGRPGGQPRRVTADDRSNKPGPKSRISDVVIPPLHSAACCSSGCSSLPDACKAWLGSQATRLRVRLCWFCSCSLLALLRPE